MLCIVPGFAGNSVFKSFKERVREGKEFVMCVSAVALMVETFGSVMSGLLRDVYKVLICIEMKI